MNSFWTEPIVLSGEQFIMFTDSLYRPDEEYMDRRNEIFAQMDEKISIKRNGMDMEVEIPDLDLSFIDKMYNNKEYIALSTIKLSEEIKFVVNNINNTRKDIRPIYRGGLTTIKNVTWDCSSSRMDMGKYMNCQMNINVSEISAKEKNSNNIMQPCGTEHMVDAA